MTIISYITLTSSIVIGVAAQLLLKYGALLNNNGIYVYLNSSIMGGLTLYFIAALFYITALKSIPVSIAFPSVSLSYVAVAFFSHLIWREPFGVQQIIALLFILTGVSLLFKSME